MILRRIYLLPVCIACIACLFWIGPVAAFVSAQEAATKQAVPRAHAHNDYLHKRPLLDALDHGFNSVEADIYLVGDQLQVAHDIRDLSSERTLVSLYLDPLKARVAAGGGRVFRDGPRFTLLIDIKSEAESTYRALHELLSRYAEMLTCVEGQQVKLGAIDVVISGNRPKELIASQSKRFCGIDGRLDDLDSTQPAHLLPMISDNWSKHFKWSGKGPMPTNERDKLQDIVRRAHQQKRVVRFWATPESQALWQELVQADVDLINTDKLSDLETFLRKQ